MNWYLPLFLLVASSSVFGQNFIKAIEDAAVPETHEISKPLISIHSQNNDLVWRTPKREELLVVTWKSERTYQKYFAKPGQVGKTSANERYVVWVTAAPEVQRFCQTLKLKKKNLSKRVKQYLGLDAKRDYDRFIEMWVRPQDLFRPCPDPEIDDDRCSLEFKSNPQAPRIKNYRKFFNNLFPKAYHEQGVPWTRLGYTYDWGNPKSDFGVSEFIIAPDSSYEVHSAKKTAEYCQP